MIVLDAFLEGVEYEGPPGCINANSLRSCIFSGISCYCHINQKTFLFSKQHIRLLLVSLLKQLVLNIAAQFKLLQAGRLEILGCRSSSCNYMHVCTYMFIYIYIYAHVSVCVCDREVAALFSIFCSSLRTPDRPYPGNQKCDRSWEDFRIP